MKWRAKTSIQRLNTHPASLLPLTTAQCIRVLHLNPGISSSPITGSLHLVDLANRVHPPYEAISYTWGPEPTSASPAVPITVDGLEVLIRQNLHKALIRLRHPNHVTCFWNDFLCIAQDDLDEKAAQVAMIGVVFREAERVRIWIGEHEDGSEMLFRGWPEELKPKNEGRVAGLSRGFGRRGSSRGLPTMDQTKRSHVWSRFFDRKYWGRTWIVQEVYQARKLIVHCGDDRMSWDSLIADRFQGDNYFDGIFLIPVTLGPGVAQLTLDTIRKISELNRNRRGRNNGEDLFEGKHILYFTQQFYKTACTVADDKIYAFLSMEGPKYRKEPLNITYRTPLPELLVSIYETRVVRYEEQLDLGAWNRALPEADLIMESLGLDREQRSEVLRMIADQAKAASDENIRLRWMNVHRGFRWHIRELEGTGRNYDELVKGYRGANGDRELSDEDLVRRSEAFNARFLSIYGEEL
jgi:hypothetical protein